MNRHERRAHNAALRQAGYYAEVNGISHARLTARAFDRLVGLLESEEYGNKLNSDHKTALFALIGSMTRMAQRELKGRWAFGLPTGTGKTTAIVSWIAAVHELGLDHISVAVSASKVEALCQLKRDLLAQQIPADKIGLIHTKRYSPERVEAVRQGEPEGDGYASEPSEGEDRQFLLITHQRVRGCKLEGFNTYHGKPRSLMLYDESLIVSDSLGIPVNSIARSLGYLESDSRWCEKHGPALEWLREQRNRIKATLAKGGGLVRVPLISPEDEAEFRQSLRSSRVGYEVLPLLDLIDQDVKAIPTNGGGIVWHKISVPPELGNVIVLDASQPIRELVHLDPTIKDAERWLPEIRRVGVPLSQLKRYDNVTLFHMPKGGGRSTMEAAFGNEKAEARKLSKEVVTVAKGIPQDEAVLLFTYKPDPGSKVNIKRILMGDLEAAGIDTKATVQTSRGTKPRINVLTWGSETGLNDFGYCRNVILVGVLQRDHVDLAAAYLGQTDSTRASVPEDTVKQLHRSEVVHCIYQALSRGSCRVTSNGMADAMKGWVVHLDTSIRGELEKVMPGAEWKPWTPVDQKFAGKVASLAKRIGDTLAGLPAETKAISTRKLKAELEAKDIPGQTWKHALNRFLEQAHGWSLEGRSLIRI